MAKRPLKQYPKTLDVHEMTGGQIFWCDEDTANTPYKASLTGAVQGIALCSAGSATQGWATIFYIEHSGNGVFVQYKNGVSWSEWVRLAKCECTEVHNLPINIAGSDNSSHYTIDQFGRVFVQIRSNLNTQWSGQKIIGTMPEGFRPKYYDAVVPLLIQNDPISYQIGQIFIQPGGNIYVHGSFTSAEYIFAQLTYPAAD